MFMGPISSNSRNGSNSENDAFGNGRRTRKPAPSSVSMLLTMPATVRPFVRLSFSSLDNFAASISHTLLIEPHLEHFTLRLQTAESLRTLLQNCHGSSLFGNFRQR